VVSITTAAATWHTWTADFWADFEQRIIGSKTIVGLWQCWKTAFEYILLLR